MKIAIIQLNSVNNKANNLLQVEHFVTKSYQECQPDLIALPEMFAFMGGTLEEKKTAAEVIEKNQAAVSLLKQLATQYKCYIHGGSIAELRDGQYFNTTVVVDPAGEIIATYRKINLFSFSSTQAQYNEGALFLPGNKITTYQAQELTAGCTICFDIRFGKLFDQLKSKKVDLIFIPSAFTYETGKAHWEILCRARAIETQSYVIAPAQTGYYYENGTKRACYGHSMIIDPWGNIIAQLQEKVGFTYAEIDKKFIDTIRQKLPLGY